jgi:hypothetical protein
MRYVIAVLLVLVILSGMVLAQDTTAVQPENVCTEADAQAFTDALLSKIESPGDNLFEHLDALTTEIETQRWKCSGMVLSGEPEAGKAVVVLGPISIPNGIYRVTLTTEEFFVADETELSGDCNLFFAEADGDASAGTEEIFEFEDDCTMLLEVEAEAAWEIRFVQVSAGG